VEYTNYFPVNFDKFVAHPEKFKGLIHHKMTVLKAGTVDLETSTPHEQIERSAR